MARDTGIRARPGRKAGEFIIELSPAWELRLRRLLREQFRDRMPDPTVPGLTPRERQARRQERRRQIRALACQFLSELITADIVGREVALATRTYYGVRRGSLREQVEQLLRELVPEHPGAVGYTQPPRDRPLERVRIK